MQISAPGKVTREANAIFQSIPARKTILITGSTMCPALSGTTWARGSSMQTFFIFCRPYTPRQSLLYELKSLASEFGINGKAILITTDTSETLAARSRQMNVYYIDREMLGGENIATLAQARLEKYLGNIFAGVREWKVIE